MSKNYKLTKKFPENFSDDIIDIVQVLTLRHGSVPFLYGSGSYKIAYPSDYDLAQEVPVTIGGKKNKLILKDLQYVIKGIMPMRNVYIGDIKSGEVPKFKVVEDDTTADNYPERRETMINKINDLYRKKHISAKEKKDSLALLQPNLGELDIYIIKHDIRFEVIRWTPQDILNGFVHYRGMKIKFEDYLYGDSITKIDVIAWLNGIRYNEVTMVYAFTTDETKDAIMLNKKFGNIELALLDQIPYLLHKGMYMKICKRINSIIRASETPDKNLLKKLYSLFVSDLGLLNQVISDIGVIEFLIENIENISENRFEYEINQMKTRLGNMTNISYLKKQNVVIKLLDELQADIVNMKLLEELEAYLRGIMEPETKKIMKKWKLFPIPSEFLPTQFKGGKLSAKHLRDLLNASYAENPPNNIDDFILDKTLSTKHVKVYHNPQNKQTVIAHRGTKEWYDWGNNIIYGLFGKKGYKLTPRFKESERVHKATVAKYGVKNLSTIGHSQGGIASEILGQEGKEIITFNKATKPFGNVKGEKQHDISTTGDLVSKLNPFQGKSKKDISLISKTTNPVKEHLLGALEGLDEDTTFGEGGNIQEGNGQKRKKADKARKGKKTHQGKKKYARKIFGALFPKIILIDTRLPHDLEDTQINLGKDEGESVTLKKKREQFEGRREFDIYPAGKYDEGLHLEAYVVKKTLHIKNIYTDARPGRGIGTYLFTILFHYLEYQRIKFDKIELVFWPSELNPLRGRIDKKTGRKQPYRHQTPAVILTAMRFYFKVFSTLVNYFPIHQGKEIQITEGTTENLLELIRDYHSDSFPSMVFTPLQQGRGQALSKRKVAPKKPTPKKPAFDAYAMPETAESISADEKKDMKIHKEIVKIKFEIDDTIDIRKIIRLQNKLEKLYTKLTPEGRKEYGLPVEVSPAGYVNQARIPSRRTKPPTKQRAFAIPMEGREGFHVV